MKWIVAVLFLFANLVFGQVMPTVRDKAGNEIPVNKYVYLDFAPGDTSMSRIAHVLSIEGKIGFYNSYGNEVLPPAFDEAEVINRPDKASVIKVTSLLEGEVRREGVMDLKGNMIVPQIYSSIAPMHGAPGPFQWLNLPGEIQGVLEDYSRVVIPAQYREINVVDGSRKTFFNVLDRNGDLALLDSVGTTIIPFGLSNYDIYPDENSPPAGPAYFQLYKKKKYGYASSTKGVIISIQYESVESIVLDDQIFFHIAKGNKRGLADGEGKLVIPPEYGYIESMWVKGKAYCVVKKGKKFGIIDGTWKLIVPIEYSSIDSLGETNGSGIFTLTDKNGQTYLLTSEHTLIKSKE